jgi:hypothetical protein
VNRLRGREWTRINVVRSRNQKTKSKLNHEGHEEHEVYNQIISQPFVAFVIFVVRMSFVECCIYDE